MLTCLALHGDRSRAWWALSALLVPCCFGASTRASHRSTSAQVELRDRFDWPNCTRTPKPPAGPWKQCLADTSLSLCLSLSFMFIQIWFNHSKISKHFGKRYQWSSDANLKVLVPEGEALSCAKITRALSDGCLNHRLLFKHIAVSWCLLSIGLRHLETSHSQTIAACFHMFSISILFVSSCALWSHVKCEGLMRGESIEPLEKSPNNWLQRAPKISVSSRLLPKLV